MHSHPYNAQASDQDMKNLKIKTGTVYHRDSKVLFSTIVKIHVLGIMNIK